MTEARTSGGMVSSAQQEYDTLRNVLPESPCPYLPGMASRNEAYLVEGLAPTFYEHLVCRGFRRAGRVVYRPRCRDCRECRSLRLSTADFVMTHSMRRVARRNADMRVEVGEPAPTPEKFDIFQRYLDAQHDGTMERTYEAFRDFLYDSPMETVEFRYRLGRRLAGISLADRLANGLSSVYMYFDPDFANHSPGTYSVLWEVDYARREHYAYYYLGFYVARCPKMAYKARFRPAEILVGDDRWVVFPG